MPSSSCQHHQQSPRPLVRLPPIRSISGVACHLPPLPASRPPTTQVAHSAHTVKKARRQVSVRACAACKVRSAALRSFDSRHSDPADCRVTSE